MTFYKNGDSNFMGFQFWLRPGRDVRNLDVLCRHLSTRIPGLPLGVRYIFTLDGYVIRRLEEIEDGGTYVCSSDGNFKVRFFEVYELWKVLRVNATVFSSVSYHFGYDFSMEGLGKLILHISISDSLTFLTLQEQVYGMKLLSSWRKAVKSRPKTVKRYMPLTPVGHSPFHPAGPSPFPASTPRRKKRDSRGGKRIWVVNIDDHDSKVNYSSESFVIILFN